MAGSTFGTLFRLTSFGESHGPAIGGIVDGCPAGLQLDLERIGREMARRRPGQSAVTTQRNEPDEVEILSGVAGSVTLGTPIGFLIRNRDFRSDDYKAMEEVFRPSHADFTYQSKYGLRDPRGGGRSSARETAARVFAGAVAKQLLERYGISVTAWVSATGTVSMPDTAATFSSGAIESSVVRCPDSATSEKMVAYINELRAAGDTCGGIVSARATGLPVGLGEPVFDKLSSDLARACMSINAAHGFEFGSGFGGASMKGSVHNDAFYTDETGKIRTRTNHSGGIQGGLSNGMDIVFRVAFKPVSTLLRNQQTINSSGEEVTLNPGGRHDPCVVPRAVPIVEAMAALTLADHLLRNLPANIQSIDQILR